MPEKNNKRKFGPEEAAPSKEAVKHQDDNSYIINSASFHSIPLHQKFSNMTRPPITPKAWTKSVQDGLKNWVEPSKGKAKASHVASTSQMMLD
jgi:hypothetical protein